jgi:hypothetical protein
VIDILAASAETLGQFGFSTSLISIGTRQAVAFEDATVLGFVLDYADATSLIEGWGKDIDQVQFCRFQYLRSAAHCSCWSACRRSSSE